MDIFTNERITNALKEIFNSPYLDDYSEPLRCKILHHLINQLNDNQSTDSCALGTMNTLQIARYYLIDHKKEFNTFEARFININKQHYNNYYNKELTIYDQKRIIKSYANLLFKMMVDNLYFINHTTFYNKIMNLDNSDVKKSISSIVNNDNIICIHFHDDVTFKITPILKRTMITKEVIPIQFQFSII